MSAPKTTLWNIEPHTEAKHKILKNYLGAWFGILAKYNRRIVYLDGFCGPGRYAGGEDGSPIIALDHAIYHANTYRNTEFVLLFFDENQSRVEHLKSEIQAKQIPSNVKALPHHTEFENETNQMLSHLEQNKLTLAPTFAFIDPFGFSGIPFDIVVRLLRNKSTEVFINIMADSINRFVDHPNDAVPQHIIDTFGTSQVIDAIKMAGNRFDALRDLYQSQLSKHAKYVRYFEMRNEKNRTIYYLFFASNNELGHKKIKEAFWKADIFSGYMFSDKTNPDQMVLFSGDPFAVVANQLINRFAGGTVTTNEIFEFINNKTSYIESHAKNALKHLELKGKIEVQGIKTDGKKRLARSFPPSVVITFI